MNRTAILQVSNKRPWSYWHRLKEAAGKGFFDDEWSIAPEADRMGVRFRGGRKLEFVEREAPFGAGSDPSNIVAGVILTGQFRFRAEPNRLCCTAMRYRAADI